MSISLETSFSCTTLLYSPAQRSPHLKQSVADGVTKRKLSLQSSGLGVGVWPDSLLAPRLPGSRALRDLSVQIPNAPGLECDSGAWAGVYINYSRSSELWPCITRRDTAHRRKIPLETSEMNWLLSQQLADQLRPDGYKDEQLTRVCPSRILGEDIQTLKTA